MSLTQNESQPRVKNDRIKKRNAVTAKQTGEAGREIESDTHRGGAVLLDGQVSFRKVLKEVFCCGADSPKDLSETGHVDGSMCSRKALVLSS